MSYALRLLSDCDPDLAAILSELGPPPFWTREPGFPTLVHIILEQQVSLASAKAAFERLLTLASPLSPQKFLALDETALKLAGFSRQKILYTQDLARSIIENKLNLSALDAMSDDDVRAELTNVKGIGSWTADIYLLMALRRPNAWPSGDLALAVAVQRVKHLSSRPTPKALTAISEPWCPWRAVAARLLWHFYLSSSRKARAG